MNANPQPSAAVTSPPWRLFFSESTPAIEVAFCAAVLDLDCHFTLADGVHLSPKPGAAPPSMAQIIGCLDGSHPRYPATTSRVREIAKMALSGKDYAFWVDGRALNVGAPEQLASVPRCTCAESFTGRHADYCPVSRTRPGAF